MADTTITNLPNAAALTGTERVPMDQGATTVDATTQAIANLAPPTNLTYDPATRLLSSSTSTGEDVTLPLVNTTAAGLIPHTWLTGAEAAILPHIHGGLAGVVYEHVRNASGAPMAALTPYHVVGSQGDTDRVLVVPANASDPATMPASGILTTALANNEDGHGVIAGVPTGVNTVANPSGTVLYVGTGVLTPTAPAANVQAIAIVGRSHASTGTLAMLSGPALARVAYTGAYGDLIGLPTLPAPADQAPAPLGTSAIGASAEYAREDHVHQMPSAGDVGADAAGTAAGAVSVHVAASDPHTQYLAKVPTPGTLTYAATVNLDMTALAGLYATLSLTGNVTFTASNMAAGRMVTLRIACDGTQRTLGFPAGWRFIGTKPANIAASKIAILTVMFFGMTEADGVAAYGVES